MYGLFHFLYKRKKLTFTIIKPTWRLYQATGVVPSCVTWYMHTKHATRKTNQWWKCVKRSSTGCRRSLITTLQNEHPVLGHPHNHAPSDTSTKYSKTRNAMKDLATNARDKPSQIFAQVVSQCDDKPFCPDTSVQPLQSQPPMQMSDCLRSTQQLPATNSSCYATTARMQKTEC